MMLITFSSWTSLKSLFPAKSICLPLHATLVLMLLLPSLVQPAWPQAGTQQTTALKDSIAIELKWIEDAPHRHVTDIQLGRLWAHLAFDYQDEGEVQLSEEAYSHALSLLQTDPSARGDYATALDSLGSLYLETGRTKESENCKRKALAVRETLGDQLGAAQIRTQLAVVLVNQHKLKEAEQEALAALQVVRVQQNPNPSDIAAALVPLSYARCLQNRCQEGLADASQAVDIVRIATLQPGTAWLVGAAWLTLGFAQWKTGDDADAENSMRESLRILRSQSGLPNGVFLWAMVQYSDYLKAMHRKTEAHQLGDEIARLTNEQTRACKNCTVDIHALSNAMW